MCAIPVDMSGILSTYLALMKIQVIPGLRISIIKSELKFPPKVFFIEIEMAKLFDIFKD